MAGMVVIFDFDKTIIDCDSDNWVVEELGINHLFTQLLHKLPWNSIMVSLYELLTYRFELGFISF